MNYTHMLTLPAVLLLAGLCTAQDPKGDKPAPKPDDAAKQAQKAEVKGYAPGSTVDATLALKDLDGKERKLSEFQGKVTVVDFWSTTCPISMGWETRLTALAEEYAKKGVQFVAINSNSTEHGSKLETVKKYVERTKVPYTILVDEKNAVADKFWATHTPHVFLLDAKGVVKYVGAIDDDSKGANVKKQHLRDALDAVLAGKEPETTKTQQVGCTIKRVPKDAGYDDIGEKPKKDAKGDGKDAKGDGK
jgi:thiol-disulfide isomerase/thioredoxin